MGGLSCWCERFHNQSPCCTTVLTLICPPIIQFNQGFLLSVVLQWKCTSSLLFLLEAKCDVQHLKSYIHTVQVSLTLDTRAQMPAMISCSHGMTHHKMGCILPQMCVLADSDCCGTSMHPTSMEVWDDNTWSYFQAAWNIQMHTELSKHECSIKLLFMDTKHQSYKASSSAWHAFTSVWACVSVCAQRREKKPRENIWRSERALKLPIPHTLNSLCFH